MAQDHGNLRVNPADETILTGGVAVRFLVTGENSNGSVAIFELAVPAVRGLPVPAHSHSGFEETVLGISGQLTWTVDDETIEVGPGAALCIPRGAVHRFDNAGDVPARALCVISPAALGPQYFREVAQEFNAAAGNAPDKARMVQIMRRHGLVPAPPRN